MQSTSATTAVFESCRTGERSVKSRPRVTTVTPEEHVHARVACRFTLNSSMSWSQAGFMDLQWPHHWKGGKARSDARASGGGGGVVASTSRASQTQDERPRCDPKRIGGNRCRILRRQAEWNGTYRGEELDEDGLAAGHFIEVVRVELDRGNRGHDGEEEDSTHHCFARF